MPGSPLVSALGCAIRIDTENAGREAAAEIARVWADAGCRLGDPLPLHHATVRIPQLPTLEEQLSALSQAVTLAAIEARRGELWMLHAAGIADDQGRVVALIGPSGKGKTTAARTLSTHFGYVSDETVGISPDGTVAPYRKPLSVIEGSARVKAQRSPHELGLLALPEAPLRLAAIVLLDRRLDGPDVPVLEDCDLGDALPELIAQTSYLGELSAPLRTIAALADSTGGVRRVIYREAATLPEALAPLFRDPEQVRTPAPLEQARPTHGSTGFHRGSYLDALALPEPDRIALLQPEITGGATFRLLAGIGPALWRAACGVPIEVLASAAEETYGTPEGVDVREAVLSAAGNLMDQAVLAQEPTYRIRGDAARTGEFTHIVALPLEPLAHPTPVALDGSAAEIWETIRISRGITATRLVEETATRAGLDASDVTNDVLAFLQSLEDARLIERVAP
ncbi:MAG: hypothetical protein QM713_07815 [Arachnia sp.]